MSYMLPSEDTVLAIMRKHGVTRAQLFGSAARGELRPDSDIDILLTNASDTDYSKLIALQEELEAETGLQFDLMYSISPIFIPYITPDLIDLPL